MEESKDAYLPEPGPGAWLEPPMLPSSSSSSTNLMQPTSSSLPGSNSRGKGVFRSAGAPVVMCNIDALHSNILLQDCRVSDFNFGESKTTVTTVTGDQVLADQSEGRNITNLGCKI